jgi:hypothetical protein
MSLGKSGGNTVTTTQPSAAQTAQINAQTGFLTGTVIPTYQQAVQGATDIYNQTAPGANYAAQNLAGTAGQVQNVAGTTGQSALQTGITGLENLFNPNYEQNQINAAMAPAQMQYQQNLQNLNTQFGGAGEIGSARQALAQQQLAGQTQATQAQTAAGIENQIAQQRLAAGQSVSQLGQAGLGQALTAAGQGVTAAMTPQQLYNQYASVIFGTPASSYTAPLLGQTTTSNQGNYGLTLGLK